MALHIKKPTNNKLNKSAKNIVNTGIKKPKHEYVENPKNKRVVREYANMRTDKDIVCKIRALNAVLGDKNLSITLNRLLDICLPKYINNPHKKTFYKVYYQMIRNKK